MKPLLFVLLMLVCPVYTSGQNRAIEDIPLTWANFRIIEVKNAAYAAHVSTWIEYRLSPKTTDSGVRYIVETDCYVNNANSTVTKEFIDEASAVDKQQCLQHEKGHFVICLIQQKKFQQLLAGYMFRSPVKKEVDSLFAVLMDEMEKIDHQYDQLTNHGRNGAQNQWENNLMTQLNELYPDSVDFSTTTTMLKIVGPIGKISDPINYDYSAARVAFDYSFENNRVGASQISPAFPVSIDTPYYYPATDSIMYIDGMDFTRDFELELSFGFKEKIKNFEPGVVLGWAIGSVNYVDSLNMGVSITPLDRRFYGLQERKQKKGGSVKRVPGKLKGGPHFFSVRKTGNSYYFFVDGYFEKELIYRSPKGQRLFVFAVKGLGIIHNVKLCYLE